MSVYIQIVDGKVVSSFACAQDLDYWPGTVEVGDDDPRYLDFITPKTDVAERLWRNGELVRADEELNKVQDADPKAVGTVAQWREYRRALRNYPETDNFVTCTRPVSPE